MARKQTTLPDWIRLAGTSRASARLTKLERHRTHLRLADCPAPPSIANGAPTTTGTTFGSTATYACNPGYELSGTATDTCQADRSWSDSRPPATLSTAVVRLIGFGSYSPFATTYGSTVNFTCNDCYALSGASTRTCQADGTWSGLQPTCTVVDCGMPPNPANGKATVNGGRPAAGQPYTPATLAIPSRPPPR